ncbi:hypothetical protein [Kribbia dieselivorans]|uniref:hypothetical protein n=1 Tax=Kribbia dieselivorans TaxID=331526 RepID=UPI000AC2A4DE|nr:hypothetical protein [Kribbia dieselivorans]
MDIPDPSTQWDAPVVTFRQWGSVVGGIIAVLFALGFAVYLLIYGEIGVAGTALLVALACLAWLTLAWPRLTVHLGGVRIHNPLRTVSVPWNRYDGTASKWTLQVWSEHGTHEAFGIAAKIDRRAAVEGSGTGDPVLGRTRLFGPAGEYVAPPAERPRPRVTPGEVGKILEQAKAEWVEAVVEGELPPSEAPTVVTWNWLNVAIAALGLVAVIVWLVGTFVS